MVHVLLMKKFQQEQIGFSMKSDIVDCSWNMNNGGKCIEYGHVPGVSATGYSIPGAKCQSKTTNSLF